MKIWLKYLIGVVLGLLGGFFLPASASDSSLGKFFFDFFVNVGRYSLYPMLFFSFTIAVFELRDERQLLRLSVKTFITIIGMTLLLTIIGVVSVLLVRPARITIFVEEEAVSGSLGVLEGLLSLFPSSGFEALTQGLYILPLCILAGLAGAACATDKNMSKPVVTLFDSLSRICYEIMSFIIEVMAVGMIAVSFFWMVQFKALLSTNVFRGFIILLLVDALIVIFGVYPLLLKMLFKKENPYRILYGCVSSLLVGFFSGDANMSLPVMIRHSKESLGVRRRVSSVSLPLFSVFCRAGSALTCAVSFIVIFNSYSRLSIGFFDVLWITFVSCGLSFLLGRFPSGGVYAALAVLCGLYSKDYNAAYLILKPAAFFIGAVAAMLDNLSAMFGTYIVAKSEGMVHHRETRFFI